MKHKDTASVKAKGDMKSNSGFTSKAAEGPRPSKMPRMSDRKPS